MEESRLIRILKQEAASASSYHDSELAKAQEEGLNRYFARPYGNEVKGLSPVVSHDIEDAVNWIMPELIRTVASAEDLVSLKARSADDDRPYQLGVDQQTQQPKFSQRSKADIMAAYLSHIYFEDNPGLQTTHDVTFDGLVQRVGIWKVSWEDPETEPSDLLEGLSIEQVQRYLQDSEYEILEAEAYDNGDGSERYVIEVQRTPKMGRVHIEAVPPEEFAICKTAKSVADAKYHRRKRKVFLSEMKRQYPDKAGELGERSKSTEDGHDDGRLQARFPDESVTGLEADDDEGRVEVELHEEYIRIDFDGDGAVELRHIKRIDDVVLENIRVKASDYVTWTPTRISHRAVGRSIADMLADVAKIRTEITRSYLDALSGTVRPTTYVNTTLIEQDGLDAMVDGEPGRIVPVKGDVAAAVREVITPDVSAPCLNALEYFDQRGQEASGVTKHAQGMDPSQLNKTATGIDLLQAAAKTRVEMVARWLGLGLEDVFKRILQLIVAHQDQPRQVKLFGEWCEVDPRTWSDEMSVAVNVGTAGVSKQARLAHLQMVAESQLNIITQFGMTNPMVQMSHMRNSLAAITSLMGFRDASLFYGEVPEGWAPEPQPDPKTIEVQGKMQLEQQKAQIQVQADQQKLATERERAAAEIQLAREKAAAEMQLAREKMLNEMQLNRERMAFEAQQAERDSQRRHEVGLVAAKHKANGMSNGSGYRPGGSLAE